MDVASISFQTNELPTEAQNLVTEAEAIFLTRVKGNSEKDQPVKRDDSALPVKIFLELHDPSVLQFTLDTDESYMMSVVSGGSDSVCSCSNKSLP